MPSALFEAKRTSLYRRNMELAAFLGSISFSSPRVPENCDFRIRSWRSREGDGGIPRIDPVYHRSRCRARNQSQMYGAGLKPEGYCGNVAFWHIAHMRDCRLSDYFCRAPCMWRRD